MTCFYYNLTHIIELKRIFGGIFMRKLIIDTDTAGDDAVALIMALKSPEIHIEAITTVSGNVPCEQAVKNALQTIEIVNTERPPVFMGVSKPLFRDLFTSVGVHGEDGMGDSNLINPALSPETGHAVDKILEIVKENPGEIEILTIGPATNIALALLKDIETMKSVKQIYSMGTAGFGKGNVTPVAEFNVFVDAEAYDIMVNSGIPLTIIGFDVCLGDAALNQNEMDSLLQSGKKEAEFAVRINKTLLEYNLKAIGKHLIDLPDAVAMAVLLWDDIVIESKAAHCYTCISDDPAYGQVIIDEGSIHPVSSSYVNQEPNATVCKTLNNSLMKQRILDLLMK
jgi:inosine-uridine nucleoside N-ribohydrolase